MGRPPVFVLGCTKSGTSLLRNLFDGHPSVFAAPLETHFFQYAGAWVNFFFRRSQPKNYTFDEMKNQMIKWIDFSNRRVNAAADGFSAGKWDLETFKNLMLSTRVNSLRELSDLYIESIYTSLFHQPYPNIHFIEKSVENTEFALEWLQLYPDAKFIHILRNPYSNLVALRKFMNSTRVPFLNRALISMHDSYYYLYKNLRLVDPDQYKVIIYDNLINDPEHVMRELADYIGIEFSDVLLKPMVLGELWSGNSSRNINFTGVSNANLENWKNDITRYEVEVVNELFGHVLRDFGFDTLETGKLKKNVFPKEGFINYVMNKISYYYLPKPKIILTDAERKNTKNRHFIEQPVTN